MDKKLLNEIKRIKELSSIKENKEILSEGDLNELVEKLKRFFEIVGDDIKNSEIGKKLKRYLDGILEGKDPFDISIITGGSSEKPDEQVSSTSVPDKAKTISSSDDDFYKQIISGLGAEWNDVNKLIMYSWRRAEGATCRNNPFNTKFNFVKLNLQYCNPEGVKHYPSKEDGVKATLNTFFGKYKDRYKPMVDALKNSDADEFFNALESSPWGTNADLARQIYNHYVTGVSYRTPTPIA